MFTELCVFVCVAGRTATPATSQMPKSSHCSGSIPRWVVRPGHQVCMTITIIGVDDNHCSGLGHYLPCCTAVFMVSSLVFYCLGARRQDDGGVQAKQRRYVVGRLQSLHLGEQGRQNDWDMISGVWVEGMLDQDLSVLPRHWYPYTDII